MGLDLGIGNHISALKLREERTAILASNLANASTPHYKASDFNFSEALQDARGQSSTSPTLAMVTTNSSHIANFSRAANYAVEYGIPVQGSFDKNTVDTDQEKEKLAENTLQYQATLNFIKGNVKTLMSATQGE